MELFVERILFTKSFFLWWCIVGESLWESM